MSDDPSQGGLHIDSDWKEEAAREKERLARETEAAASRAGDPGAGTEGPSLFDIINLLAMQAAVGLGGMRTPDGQNIPPNLASAKHHIDLLDVLEAKTKGNLSDEEKQVLDNVLYELRMQYVSIVNKGSGGAASGPASPAGPA